MTEDIWNTTCPVCGSCVPEGMPLVELAPASRMGYRARAQEEQPGLRLCSKGCAAIAQKSPEKYRAIALASANRAARTTGPALARLT